MMKVTAWQEKDGKIVKCEHIFPVGIIKACTVERQRGHMINSTFYPSTEWTFDIENYVEEVSHEPE
ncbi:MAG: hypothetical protein AB7D36_09090 [Oscillospiraceae bacterium]